jgi:hypothetical protein
VDELAAEFGIERRTVSARLHRRGVAIQWRDPMRSKRKRSRCAIAAGLWRASARNST